MGLPFRFSWPCHVTLRVFKRKAQNKYEQRDSNNLWYWIDINVYSQKSLIKTTASNSLANELNLNIKSLRFYGSVPIDKFKCPTFAKLKNVSRFKKTT